MAGIADSSATQPRMGRVENHSNQIPASLKRLPQSQHIHHAEPVEEYRSSLYLSIGNTANSQQLLLQIVSVRHKCIPRGIRINLCGYCLFWVESGHCLARLTTR